VTPAGFDPKTETLKIAVETPQPSGIDKDSIVFLFEQGEPTNPDPTKGPQYLGEFRVTESAGQQATLVSVQLLDDFEKQRLARSHGPWALYETMPVDRFDIFTGLSDEQLRKWLPEKSIQEYLRHGKAATRDDDEFRRLGDSYQRRLRDYASEFDALARQRIVMLADMAAVTKDNERLKSSLASAKEIEAFRQEELRKLGIDRAGIVKERKVMEQHLATVQQQLANAKQLLAQALAENRRLADQLSGRQSAPAGPGASGAPARGPLALSNVN
jgi:regulator of replication initiation timing